MKTAIAAHTAKDRTFLAVLNALMAIFLLIMLYPLWIVAVSSISLPSEVSAGRVWLWPVGLSLEGYQAVLKYKLIGSGYVNSLFLMIAGTAFSMVVTILGAYPLSRQDMPGRNGIMLLFTFTMFFSGGLVPFFILMRDLKLINSLWALILPAAINVWNIILMKTYFQSNIPAEIHQAAQIDGASDIRFLLQVVIPLSKPIIAVLALFTAVSFWNSYFNALIFINDTGKFPLQLVLRDILIVNQSNPTQIGQNIEGLKNKQALIESLKYSVIVVSSLPLMIAYPFVQKFFVTGIVVGSLKG
jgi:multiple sugar transport system permease protein/putative aldouronate transport system permease protein